MKKIFALIFVLLLLLQPALAEKNLIENGDFEDGDSLTPSKWRRDCWYNDEGVSYLEIDENGYEGSCIKIDSRSENDARFIQTVDVKEDTLYKITCMVKAEGIPEGLKGATISIGNTFTYSASAYDTDGRWAELSLYGRTGEDQDQLDIYARIGGYGELNTGCAWFDNFEMCEIDEVPSGCEAQSFATMEPSGGDSSDDDTTDEDEMPTRYTEAWLLMSFGMVLAAIALCKKAPALRLSRRGNTIAIICAIVLAFIVRCFVASSVYGYRVDIGCFNAWGSSMLSSGISRFYSDVSFCDYPPVYMLVLGAVEAIRRLFGFEFESGAQLLLLKFVPIMFDLGIAYIIYFVAKKRIDPAAALALFIAAAFNPAMIADSAAWGQIDSVFTFIIVLSGVFVYEEKYIFALPLITLGILTKPQSLLVAPIGLVAIVTGIIRSDDKKKLIRDALIGLGITLVLILGLTLLMYDREMNPFEWLKNIYFGTMSSYAYMTTNACNLYEVFKLNWAQVDRYSGLTIFAWCMFALAYVYSAVVCVLSKEKKSIFLIAASLLLMIFAFAPMMHERYVYPALALLLMAYVYERDRRVLVSACALSVTLFLNIVLVLQGGMGTGNYGHLYSGEDWLNVIVSLLTVINALFTAYLTFDICVRKKIHEPKPADQTEKIINEKKDYKLNLKRFDYIFMAAITAAYSILAFVNLGVTKAPETSWTTSTENEYVVIDLGDVETWRMEYYGGICDTSFKVSLSNDGENWTEEVYARYDQGQIFRWLVFVPSTEEQTTDYALTMPTDDGSAYINYAGGGVNYPYQTARYVKLSAVRAGLILSEVGFIREDLSVIKTEISEHGGYDEDRCSDASLLIDEQETVPEHPSYLNSTYFDEIYHARTAYEHLKGLNTYEWTHPPLGKVLMMFGVKIFGMDPFGWRFMGTLMGVLMLPVIYLMVKQLGLSSMAAALATFLMSVDSMHFTQTRIATIDSYAVFFIMLMYLFMFRYARMNIVGAPFKKKLVPLILCGVTMGCAWATKWIGLYASVGLAIIFFVSLIYPLVTEKKDTGRISKKSIKETALTMGICLVFYIVIPALIYYLSYYWQLQYEGGLSVSRVIDLQKSMFSYHAGLGGDTHYFRSPWYEWPVIAWPMWYYSGTEWQPDGVISSISAMGNPAVWWTGLVAMVALLVWVCARRKSDGKADMISIGFLSQYLPWVLVPRSTFIYHYFASVPFIIIAIGYWFDFFKAKKKKTAFVIAIALCVIALILFIMFYPLESGTPVARSFAEHLRWFKWYNF